MSNNTQSPFFRFSNTDNGKSCNIISLRKSFLYKIIKYFKKSKGLLFLCALFILLIKIIALGIFSSEYQDKLFYPFIKYFVGGGITLGVGYIQINYRLSFRIIL